MNTILMEKAVRSGVLSLPCATVILPLEVKHTDKYLLQLSEQAEREMNQEYRKTSKEVLRKLSESLSGINYDSGKKSAIVFVSPIYEKVIYLDIPLEEKVIVDQQFEIRDLVASMNPAGKFIVLVQSGTQFKIYLGDGGHLINIKVNIPDHMAAYKNDIAEKIEYFSDVTDRKEIMLDKFIHHIDKELQSILNKLHLPVFVVGAERMNGHFKKITHNEKDIVEYIHGNYDEYNPVQLLALIRPFLDDLKKKEDEALNLDIEHARSANQFSFGIEEVWRYAMHKNSKMLLVEKNYIYPHIADGDNEHLNGKTEGANPAFIKDAVDVIIEKVLESSGAVKFVDEEMLKDFQHIALFLYY